MSMDLDVALIALIVPLVTALVQGAKGFPAVAERPRWLPVLAVAFGCVVASVIVGLWGHSDLAGARRAGNVADDTPVVVFEAGGKTLVLVSSSMSYHHVAQGEMAGEPWMVTF